MRKVLLLGSLSVATALAFVACDDSSSSSSSGALPEAGAGFEASAPEGDSAAPTVDAGLDGGDSGTADAPEAEAGLDAGPKNALFAHISETLVSVNPETGAVTDIGATAQEWIVLAWDDVAKVARVILAPYSPVGGAATPHLGTIDLCTGAVTDGPAITIGGTQVLRAESLAQDPTTGTFYISVGTAGTGAASEYLSEKNGTIDVATGAVTVNGSHDTFQDDGDCSTFIGGSFRLLDVASTNNTGGLYVIDKTTGAASAPITTGPNVRRVAHDPTRGVMFTTYGTGVEGSAGSRSVGTLNLTTGANTPLGTVLAAGTYGGSHFTGLLSAPAPVCP